jgi:hypothetical protein
VYLKTKDEIQSFGISLCVVNLQAGIEISRFCGIYWEAPFVNWSESGQSEGQKIYIHWFWLYCCGKAMQQEKR